MKFPNRATENTGKKVTVVSLKPKACTAKPEIVGPRKLPRLNEAFHRAAMRMLVLMSSSKPFAMAVLSK